MGGSGCMNSIIELHYGKCQIQFFWSHKGSQDICCFNLKKKSFIKSLEYPFKLRKHFVLRYVVINKHLLISC